MAKNGFTPVHRTEKNIIYRCPLHEDKTPSFSVSASAVVNPATGDSSQQAFHCFSCKRSGYGAIDLQAVLMGVEAKGDDFMRVVARLCADHHVRINGFQPAVASHYRNVEPVDRLTYTECEWTAEYLRALGCRTTIVYGQPAEEGGVEENTGRESYSWGDGYYVNRFERRSDNLDAREVSRVFSIHPVSSFTRPARMIGERMQSKMVIADDDRPAFVIDERDSYGNRRAKCYIPYADGDKWGVYNVEQKHAHSDFGETLNGDCDVVACLYDAARVPQTTSPTHPTVEKTARDADGSYTKVVKFRRVAICSGPRDAMQVYFHSDCHVVYPNSETAKIKGSLLARLRQIADEVYILFDSDATGRKNAVALNLDNIWMHNVELPRDLSERGLSRRTGRPMKDAAEYFEQYGAVLRQDGRQMSINEHFQTLLSGSSSLQFYVRQVTGTKKDRAAGVMNVSYKIMSDTMNRFLQYSGLCRYRATGGDAQFCYVHERMVQFIKERDVVSFARRMMCQWAIDHNVVEGSMLHDIQQSRTPSLETFRLLDEVQLDFVSDGTDYQYLFFRNGALLVKADSLALESYHTLPFYVNVDCIMPYDYHSLRTPIKIEPNQRLADIGRTHRERLALIDRGDEQAVAREVENYTMQQKLWAYSLTFGREMNRLPIVVQFVYDTCRLYWREEQSARDFHGDPVTEEQQQTEDTLFVAKMAALGYLLHRHHDRGMQYIVLSVDYNVENEKKATGRTGKSIFPSLLRFVTNVHEIDGKAVQTTREKFTQNFSGLDYMANSVVNMNDLPRNFDIDMMYNIAEGKLRIKWLYKDEQQVPDAYVPKFYMSYNRMFDTTNDSTRGRLWELPFCDYYHIESHEHGECSPRTKFNKEISVQAFSEQERDETVSFLIFCLQLHLQTQCKIEIPDTAAMQRRRLYANADIKDKAFIEWADRFFAIDGIYGYPVAQTDALVSWYEYNGWAANKKTLCGCRRSEFALMLMAYCQQRGIVVNPRTVFRTDSAAKRGKPRATTFQYVVNRDTGEVTGERRRDNDTYCYYFYTSGQVPKSPAEVTTRVDKDIAPSGYTIE